MAQSLYCKIYPHLNKYDEQKGAVSTFAKQLLLNQSLNWIKEKQCQKREAGTKIDLEACEANILHQLIEKKNNQPWITLIYQLTWRNYQLTSDICSYW